MDREKELGLFKTKLKFAKNSFQTKDPREDHNKSSAKKKRKE